MRVIILGSGNVATVLGKRIHAAGHEIIQVYSRQAEHARQLAQKLDAGYTDQYDQLSREAELYIACLSDSALYPLSKELILSKGLLVHTAGSVPMDVLKECSKNYGVLYPLQSLRKEMETIPEIPFFIESNTADDLCLLQEFAGTLSNSVSIADSATRMKWHIGAVIASNFVNLLYTLAETYCKKEGLDFQHLLPLIGETALRLQHASPADLQTGPAVRNDQVTIEKHVEVLSATDPTLASKYRELTAWTLEVFKTKGKM